MKHYYESEILNQLMERDGLNNPSSSPVYESEIREQLLNQVTPSYPKLNDYEAEWLMYNHTKHLPADFPVESVTNVSQATFNNVVPYAYGKAILKGQTLVNLWGTKREHFFTNGTFENSVLTSNDWCCLYRVEFFKPNTEYTLITNIISISDTNTYFKANNASSNGIFKTETSELNKVGIYVEKVVSYDDFTGRQFSARSSVSGGGTIQFNMVVLEGDYTNVDIPYFEGMQSVKMPVLTTTGKNVFDLANSGLREESAYDKSLYSSGFWSFGIQLEPNKDVTISRKNSEGYNLGLNLKIHNENTSSGGKWLIANHAQSENKSSATLTTNSDGYIWFIFSNNFDKINQILDMCEYIQIEYGTVATSYEPYKSNILTVNEDLTLRSNGDVYDELNLLTGRLTQRIDENNEVLAQEVVKTVDLTCKDQDGEPSLFMPIEGTTHLETLGQAIKPQMDVEIPVEAITQNLASFIDMEGEDNE